MHCKCAESPHEASRKNPYSDKCIRSYRAVDFSKITLSIKVSEGTYNESLPEHDRVVRIFHPSRRIENKCIKSPNNRNKLSATILIKSLKRMNQEKN